MEKLHRQDSSCSPCEREREGKREVPDKRARAPRREDGIYQDRDPGAPLNKPPYYPGSLFFVYTLYR